MKRTEEIKERIIRATLEVMQESGGEVAQITTREIAQKAGVGNGLINYHFKTKENLITICVQRVIEDVVMGFEPGTGSGKPLREHVIDTTCLVFEFLFAKPTISRISILGDFHAPSENNNTIKSQKSVQHILGNRMEEADQKFFSFLLVAAMQSAFLNQSISKASFGMDLATPESRRAFLTRVVTMLLCGVEEG